MHGELMRGQFRLGGLAARGGVQREQPRRAAFHEHRIGIVGAGIAGRRGRDHQRRVVQRREARAFGVDHRRRAIGRRAAVGELEPAAQQRQVRVPGEQHARIGAERDHPAALVLQLRAALVRRLDHVVHRQSLARLRLIQPCLVYHRDGRRRAHQRPGLRRRGEGQQAERREAGKPMEKTWRTCHRERRDASCAPLE
ncbi:hypothetical protein ACS0X5_32650 [Burkholderia gladioli]|uniref:hypothetical protein n=1 Tax=Burkholderia gladioli TaxID=28095 RepID=UPI003F7AE0FB